MGCFRGMRQVELREFFVAEEDVELAVLVGGSESNGLALEGSA